MEKENDTVKIQVIDIRAIIKVLAKRKLVIILGTLLFIFIGALLSFWIIKPTYDAQVLLRVNNPLNSLEERNAEEGLESVVNTPITSQMTMQTHIGQLKSEVLLNRVYKKLKLTPERLNDKLLSEIINVELVEGSNLILVTVGHDDAALATTIANALSEEYISFITETTQRELERLIPFLNEQYVLTREDLRTALIKLNELRALQIDTLSPEQQAQVGYCEAEVNHLTKNMDLLAERLLEARMASSLDLGQTSVLVVSKATVPEKPVKPNQTLNLVLSFILGLFVFVPLAFLIEHMDYKIKSSEDVEENLQLSTLGIIPKTKIKHNSLLTKYQPRSVFAEAFRTFRTNFNFASPGNPCRSLLFTSPASNDGKSTVVSNLAVVLAQAGKKVLLVDADFRNPSLHKVFELDNSSGLVNVLVKKVRLDEQTNPVIEGLWVLTSGPIPPNPSEIILLDTTKEFWQEQVKSFDYVLIDSAPVIPVTDSVLLSTQVDGVILVINSSTRVETAIEAKTRLAKVKQKTIGVVLNKVKINNMSYYY